MKYDNKFGKPSRRGYDRNLRNASKQHNASIPTTNTVVFINISFKYYSFITCPGHTEQFYKSLKCGIYRTKSVEYLQSVIMLYWLIYTDVVYTSATTFFTTAR